MPRNVRNFWVDVYADGMAGSTGVGPRSAGGGLDIDVAIRENGEVRKAVRLMGRVSRDGGLVLTVFEVKPHAADEELLTIQTKR